MRVVVSIVTNPIDEERPDGHSTQRIHLLHHTARHALEFYSTVFGGTLTLNTFGEQQMWGDTFGRCLDRFGVTWMVDIGAEPHRAHLTVTVHTARHVHGDDGMCTAVRPA